VEFAAGRAALGDYCVPADVATSQVKAGQDGVEGRRAVRIVSERQSD
jgi:hypothetical protein